MNKILTLIYAFAVFSAALGQNTFPSSGSVGIGTTSPDHLLQLHSGSNPTLAIGKPSNTGGSSTLLFQAGDAAVANGFLVKYWKKQTPNPFDELGFIDGGGHTQLSILNGVSPMIKIGQMTNTGGKSSLSFNAGDNAAANNFILTYNKTTSTDRLSFVDGGGVETLTLTNGGKVGINAVSPVAKLQVGGTIYSAATATNTVFPGATAADNANFIGSQGYWAMRTSTNWAYNLDVYNSGTPKAAMTVLQNGNIGIGSLAPDQKLTVNGTIHATEVRVDLTVPGPDYVFDTNYNLPSLETLHNYIKENKHLPEVSSAKEMKENGVLVGEMNMLLLKKIEELTLYIIDQNTKLEQQQKETNALASKVAALEKVIEDTKRH